MSDEPKTVYRIRFASTEAQANALLERILTTSWALGGHVTEPVRGETAWRVCYATAG